MKFDPTEIARRVQPLRTVLVPLDGSALSRRALPFAAALAGAANGRLVLVHATWLPRAADPEWETLAPVLSGAEAAAAADLETAAAPLRARGLRVETRVYGQAPEVAIAQAARDEHARFVVMASHARHGPGRWLFGSVAEDVLRHTDVPVIVVPERAGDWWDGRHPLRIVVPLDETDLAEEALGPACELAASGGQLVLLRVVEPPEALPEVGYAVKEGEGLVFGDALPHPARLQPAVDHAYRYLTDVADRIRGIVPGVEVRVEVGDACQAIADAAAATRAHLIAMATHRRGELERLVLGSHAIAVLRRADVPVLMVRPGGLAEVEPATEVGEAVPRGPLTVELSAEELELVRCGLNRLLDDPTTGADLEDAVFALEARLARAAGPRTPVVPTAP
jgi:nucleotide-binding universal stress UspA family protein